MRAPLPVRLALPLGLLAGARVAHADVAPPDDYVDACAQIKLEAGCRRCTLPEFKDPDCHKRASADGLIERCRGWNYRRYCPTTPVPPGSTLDLEPPTPSILLPMPTPPPEATPATPPPTIPPPTPPPSAPAPIAAPPQPAEAPPPPTTSSGACTIGDDDPSGALTGLALLLLGYAGRRRARRSALRR